MKWYDILNLVGWIFLLVTLFTSLIITKLAKKRIDNNKSFNTTHWSKILFVLIIISVILVIFSSVFEIVSILL